MNNINELFFELIRVAIGTQQTLSRVPTEKEWKALYGMAKKQSIAGICFVGVQQLSDSANRYYFGMSRKQYLAWMVMATKIQRRNEAMDEYSRKILSYFRKKGLPCTILKGQGVAQLYSSHSACSEHVSVQPLAVLRQSGDVDVWVKASRKTLYELSLKELGRLEGLTYHHIHYPLYDDCEVEAHVWPSYLTNPVMNRRFQRFCKKYEPRLNGDDTPSLAFNRVFILQHCHVHFCGHGVGVRQLLDYYFVLMQGFTEEERQESMQWIECLGMGRFAAAVMWACKQVFGMPDVKCLCPPNEKDGRFLIEEVMQTGNMGHQDERVDHRQFQTALGRYLFNLRRDWQMMRICPQHALWEPFWGIFQYTYTAYLSWWYNR